MIISLLKKKLKAICLSRIAFFVFLNSIVCLCLNAQNYYFDNYGVSDGLAQSKIYCMLQDNNGKLWLGNPSGISVFDGNSFVNYTTQDNLSKGGVKSIYQDYDETIWLGHLDGGITKYFNNTFFEVILPEEINSDITSITEDENGIWLSTVGNGAVLLKNKQNNQLDSTDIIIYKGKSLSDRVFSIYKGKANLFFITDVGIKIFNKNEKIFENLVLEGMPSLFQIICMMQDDKDNFWFGTYHDGIYKYILNKKKVEYINDKQGLDNNWVTCLIEDRNKNIWAGTWGGGLAKISTNGIINYNLKNGLQDNNILSLIEDYEGNILIGTWEHGLSIYKGEYFISYTEQNGLPGNQVSAIYQDNNNIYWFCTSAGISFFNQIKNEFISPISFQNIRKVRFIKGDKDNTIWIGTEDIGVLSYNPDKHIIAPEKNINVWNRINRITAMDIDKFNNLWVGTVDGLIFYEIKTGVSERYSQIHGLAGNSISAVFCDSKGIVWVGCEGKGISTININDSSIYTIDSLIGISPRSFSEDRNENIWIGTELGIIVFDRTKIIKRYKIEDGLLTNFITSLNTDGNNNIYIGTNIGLNKIDLTNNKLYTFTKKNGFTGIEAKPNATFKDKEGNMWFGTANGVMKYNPKLMQKPTVNPKTYIKSFKVNLTERPLSQNIKLKHMEKSVYFEFASVCITDPGAVRYQYILEGIDEDWQPPTVQRFVNYPALPHGVYTFKVKAKNHLGIWNEEPTSLRFIIKPPFYKTAWFIISAILAGIGIIMLYIKVRERNLIHEKKILEEKVEERTLEIRLKNEELARKNKDIMDSIKYAKRIQDAILPDEDFIENTFILFKPKDIVSGDFFWMAKKDNKEILAAVDCTGHGVPGAFVSFVGHNSLNKIVKEHNICQPAQILDRLDNEVTKTFNPKGEGIVNDGMDMSIICYDKKKNIMEYSGAFNPLFIFRKGELQEIKGNRFAIGRSQKPIEKKFTNHEIKISKGDTIYLFSDGFADQFGGPNNRKFMAKKFKDTLKQIQPLSMAEQKAFLEKTIMEWKGNLEQIDDILIIGKKL